MASTTGRMPANLQRWSLIALLLAMSLWGIAPVANRFLVDSAKPMITPSALLALRFGLSALVLSPILIRSGFERWSRYDKLLTLLATLCGVVGYNLPVTFGQTTVPASTTALIIATEPVWIVILWAVRRRQSPAAGAIIGALIGLAGIGVLEASNLHLEGSRSLSGMALIMAGAFCWSLYCVVSADLIRRKGSLAVTAITVSLGCVPFLAVGGLEIPQAASILGWKGYTAVGVLAVGSTVIATILWNYAVAIRPGPASGAFLHGVPIVGVFAGHFLLGELLTIQVLLAASMIVIGVVVAQIAERPGPTQSSDEAPPATNGGEAKPERGTELTSDQAIVPKG